MLWSASGAMTDLAILVTPMGWELEAFPPPETTFRANQVASATLMCSDCGSSGEWPETLVLEQYWDESNMPFVDLWTYVILLSFNHSYWGLYRRTRTNQDGEFKFNRTHKSTHHKNFSVRLWYVNSILYHVFANSLTLNCTGYNALTLVRHCCHFAHLLLSRPSYTVYLKV